MRKPRTPRWLLRVFVIEAVLASLLSIGTGVAQASPNCGTSASHTVCVTVPDGPLTGATTITVTNNPNSGDVFATWIPSGQSAITLIQDFGPSPGTNDYSFTWPTHKYLDASGVLRVQANATNSTPVDVPVTLQNGNLSDFQHSPNDWESFLPNPSWTAPADPVIAAVGDGASDEPAGDDLAHSIALSHPEVLLYLGDIYETGTFTENLNHYGQNSMDGGPGTLWGAMGTITQPAMGDHEAANSVAWQDYFHGRPLYTSFEFANVLFLDLASTGVSMAPGSAQYNYVESILTSTTNPPPACVVAYFQNPVLTKSKIRADRKAMWSLLANNGGDLVFNGNSHTMIQYKPLNDQLQLPSAGQPTMVELIDGAGGHLVGGKFTADQRVEWSVGATPGAVYIRLDGAANGGTPTSLSWSYEDKNGKPLHSGIRTCAASTTLSGFSPSSGPIGTSVTIDGSGFTGTTDVRFNGTSVGSGNFTVVSDAQITAAVPSGASTGPISVTAPGGTATSSTDFTVTPSPVPLITDFTPLSGPVGTPVTINGSGFIGTSDVAFNGTSVGSSNFTIVSDAQITATVPSGATTGPISVTTPGGIATSSDFTVIPLTTLTFGPGADTFVRFDQPSTNFGSRISFSADSSPIKHGLLKFTVSGVGSGTIQSVKLDLYCLDASDKGGDFFRVANNTWLEKTVTWNTEPPADATPIASLGAVSANTWYEVDLSSLVTGDGTYSLRIASTSSNGADYSTKEGTAGFAPQLVVTFA